MLRTARAVLLALAGLVALTGCLRVDMSLTLNEDDSADGDLVLAIAEGTGDPLGSTDEEIVDQLFGDVEADMPDATVSPYEQDGYVGKRVTFAHAPLEALAITGGELSVVRDGDDYVLTGAAPDTTGSDLGDLPEDATMTLSVTFPGAVAEANGAVEGTTVTWNLTDAPAMLEARGAASADTGVPGWIVVSVGLAVGIAAGVTLVLVTKRRARGSGAAKRQPTESA